VKTQDLINSLAEDRQLGPRHLERWFALALALGLGVSTAWFFAHIGFRPDIFSALKTIRFDFKFVVTLNLALSASLFAMRLARPDATPGIWRKALLITPALLLVAVVIELVVLPHEVWTARLIGSNARTCLSVIPLLAMAPLAALILALRQGAPANPGLAGAMAGLAASGMAATLYASNCIDDSPLFVATWYPLATGIVVLAGYLLGRRLLRW